MAIRSEPNQVWQRMLDDLSVNERGVLLDEAENLEMGIKFRDPREMFSVNSSLEVLHAIGCLLYRYPESMVRRISNGD